MPEDWKAALHASRIPDYMHGGMERWIEQGIRPGSFLCSVLSNDLMGAFWNADYNNSRLLREYCLFLYDYAPAGCYGNDALTTWKGLAYAGA